jgi:hypothetical protein
MLCGTISARSLCTRPLDLSMSTPRSALRWFSCADMTRPNAGRRPRTRSVNALIVRSYLHFLCGRFVEMLADAVAATDSDPKNCAGWINRCAALAGLGLHSSAVQKGG